MTVHSRGGLQCRELGHSPHKKSLLIYFPPNWKVHAHTWLNHHASTEDGPCRTQAKPELSFAARSWDSQAWKNTRMHCAPCNGFCRCAGPDSLFSIWPLLFRNPLSNCNLALFIPISLSHTGQGGIRMPFHSFLCSLSRLVATTLSCTLPPSSLAFNSFLQLIYHVWASWRLYAGCPCSACFRKRCLPLNLIFFI